MLRSLLCIIIVSLSFMPMSGSAAEKKNKQILGQSEMMTVERSGLMYEARMDTGAVNSSLHAVDLKVIGGEEKSMKKNIGKIVEFTTENEKGESKRVQAEIVSTSTVKNSQGTETRYMVYLNIGFPDDLKKVRVNLRDRTKMDYKLLIGRNFLKNDYIVDVSEKKVIGPVAKLNITQADMLFNARIDTGAVQNSLHAVDMKIANEDLEDMDNNIGKMITFTTENYKGEKKQITARIRNAALIRNAQGSEIRYVVRLNVGLPGEEFLVDVNLKDRSHMGHKLLIGRNWLQGHYMVDVAKKK